MVTMGHPAHMPEAQSALPFCPVRRFDGLIHSLMTRTARFGFTIHGGCDRSPGPGLARRSGAMVYVAILMSLPGCGGRPSADQHPIPLATPMPSSLCGGGSAVHTG